MHWICIIIFYFNLRKKDFCPKPRKSFVLKKKHNIIWIYIFRISKTFVYCFFFISLLDILKKFKNIIEVWYIHYSLIIWFTYNLLYQIWVWIIHVQCTCNLSKQHLKRTFSTSFWICVCVLWTQKVYLKADKQKNITCMLFLLDVKLRMTEDKRREIYMLKNDKKCNFLPIISPDI